MRLALNKNGRIGRQIPGQGLEAKVEQAHPGERRGNVYLSATQIEDDNAYWAQKENEERALNQAKAFRNAFERKAREIEARKRAQSTEAFQIAAKFDPMNEKLKAHYARRANMGESAKALEMVKPADFSSSGGNLQYVEGQPMTGGQQWDADYRQHFIVGNPLTRDGVYGPAVTDYDRFVQGVDVNQTDIVSGGTMLGRWNGGPAPAGPGHQALHRGLGSMCFDWSWECITDKLSDTLIQTADNVVDSLPGQLSKELQEALYGGGKVTSSGGGTVTVQRPVTGATTYVQEASVVKPWMIYTGIGLFGLTVLVIALKK